MQDRIMDLIVVNQTVVLTFSAHLGGRTETLTFKDHKKDQRVIQIPVILQEAQTHGYRMIEIQGIQVLVFPQEAQI